MREVFIKNLTWLLIGGIFVYGLYTDDPFFIIMGIIAFLLYVWE